MIVMMATLGMAAFLMIVSLEADVNAVTERGATAATWMRSR
jgi:hypothetical protein